MVFFGACSDNGSGPEEIPTGTSNFGYQTMSGQPTLSGDFSLSGIEMCQDLNPTSAAESYFENAETACVIGWREEGEIHVAAFDPNGDNTFNFFTFYFPEVSEPGEFEVSGCADTNENCVMLYGDGITSIGESGNLQVIGTDLAIEVSEISENRIKGQLIGDALLIFPDENRDTRSAAATANFDIPIYTNN